MDERTGNMMEEGTTSGDPGYDDLGDIGGKINCNGYIYGQNCDS